MLSQSKYTDSVKLTYTVTLIKFPEYPFCIRTETEKLFMKIL